MEPLQFDNTKDQLIWKDLSKQVNAYFDASKCTRFAGKSSYLKAILLLLAYLSAIGHIYYGAAFELPMLFFTMYLLAGILKTTLVLNIAHDAAHACFFQSKRLNAIAVRVMDFLGASSYIWKLRHVHSHHPYPNVPGWDLDISQSKLIRLNEQNPYRRVYRFQHLYMPFIYLFYTLFWLLLRDWKDWKLEHIGNKAIGQFAWKEFFISLFFKIVYVGYFILIPIICFHVPPLTVLAGFLLLHFAASAVTALALVSTHVGEFSVYPEPDANGRFQHSWFRHQLLTTFDFAPQNPWVTAFFGGFNLHLVHHLFPGVAHEHYPALTRILRGVLADYGLEYQYYPSLPAAVKSHFRHLKQQSVHPAEIFSHML
ncbi:MAG: fatty acid desaturase [Chitinophagales bacterium]|nr:fatty acid desaturase [Chitinophagales bacterium]